MLILGESIQAWVQEVYGKSLYFLQFAVNIKLCKKIKFIYLFSIEIIVQAKPNTFIITGPLVCFSPYIL